MYGTLPFDDYCHRKLLLQTHQRIYFPEKPVVSQECRTFLLKIFVKARDRISISNFDYDVWYKKFMPESTDQ